MLTHPAGCSEKRHGCVLGLHSLTHSPPGGACAVPWGLTLQAVLHDAGTFNPGDNTGGLNGSIRFELERPENQRLATVVAQVEAKPPICSCSTQLGGFLLSLGTAHRWRRPAG